MDRTNGVDERRTVFSLGGKSLCVSGPLAGILAEISAMAPFSISCELPYATLFHRFVGRHISWRRYRSALDHYLLSQSLASRDVGQLMETIRSTLTTYYEDTGALTNNLSVTSLRVTGNSVQLSLSNDQVIFAKGALLAMTDTQSRRTWIISTKRSQISGISDGEWLLEYVWFWSAVNLVFPSFDCFLPMHGCGLLSAADRALVFIGHSGAGKTTISRLCHRPVLNDDVVIVARDDRRWHLHGTPWVGREGIVRGTMRHAPLVGIVLLRQDNKVCVQKIESIGEIVKELSMHIPMSDGLIGSPNQRWLESMVGIAKAIPVYALHFDRNFDLGTAPELICSKIGHSF